MKSITMADVLMAKKVAIGVCVLSVSSLFFYNSHCLFSSFVNQERALSHAVEIVDRVYPPTVSICFPFAAILDKAKINANLDACRPAKYHNATKNDKLEFDLECTEQIRLHFLTNTSMPFNQDVNTPEFDTYVLHMTYSFWDIVEKVKVLNDKRLVDYDRFNTSISELNITEKMLDEFKCFSVKILSPKGPIHYDKANLTTDVLVDPFLDIEFNSKVKDMDMSYLFLHGNRTKASGVETRFLLEYKRAYLVGYEAEKKIYLETNFFGNKCKDYTKTKHSSQCHAIFDCIPANGSYTSESYAEEKRKCQEIHNQQDCEITYFIPQLLQSFPLENTNACLIVRVQLNLELNVITSKPRVDLEELFTFETGIIGFYFGFNLIGISSFYSKYSKLFTHRDGLQFSG